MPGQHWRLNIRLRRPHGAVNPRGFDAELYALQAGLDAYGYVRRAPKRTKHQASNQQLHGGWLTLASGVAHLRDSVQQAMGAALHNRSERTRGTLIALVTGNQNAIPPPAWQIYNRTGTAHLMSISGLHVTMFAALAVWLCRIALRGVRIKSGNSSGVVLSPVPARVFLRVPAPTISWVFGVVAAFAYSAFSGWGVPAQRTSWMLAAAGLVVISNRGCRFGVVLSAAAAVIVLLDPWAPLGAGFWLSFAAVAAIVVFAQAGPQAQRQTGASKLVAAVRTQWAATVSLIPLSAFWFGAVSGVGPFANAIAIPLVSVIITPLAMLGGLLAVVWPLAGAFMLWLAASCCDLLLWVLSAMSRTPAALLITGAPGPLAMAIGVTGAAALLLPGAPVSRVVAVCLLVPLLLLPGPRPAPGHWSLTALDVGQGTAVLVQTSNHTLLFDTGPHYGTDSGAGDRIVAPLLRARRITRLDKLVISHKDSDHSGGAPSLLTHFDIGEVLTSVAPNHLLRRHPSADRECRRGQSWSWDGVQFDVLHPGIGLETSARSRTNARSCVVRISSPGGSALLTGDIEKAQEKLLLKLFKAKQLSADVLLVPHHGSGTSSSPDFLDAVAPRWALVQAGYRNRFRHPAQRVLARYHARHINLLRSDRDGAVEFNFVAGKEPQVTRYRRLRAPYWRVPDSNELR